MLLAKKGPQLLVSAFFSGKGGGFGFEDLAAVEAAAWKLMSQAECQADLADAEEQAGME